jgi:hypothetical protein
MPTAAFEHVIVRAQAGRTARRPANGALGGKSEDKKDHYEKQAGTTLTKPAPAMMAPMFRAAVPASIAMLRPSRPRSEAQVRRKTAYAAVPPHLAAPESVDWTSPVGKAVMSFQLRQTLLNASRNLIAIIACHGYHIAPQRWSVLMKYLPPYEALKSYLTVSTAKGEVTVSGSYENFVQLIRQIIIDVPVDEPWYLERYPDIAEAISQGVIASPKSHFVNDGYFEGRIPFPIKVDERYYLTQNSGVAEHVRKGQLASGQQHFDEHGYQEGRLPFGL